MAHVKIQPRCKCGKYLADYGRIHADKSPACDCWFKDTSQHGVQSIAPGPFDVYSDSDGHYAVMCGDGKIQHWGIAHDYATMKAIEFNRGETIPAHVK